MLNLTVFSPRKRIIQAIKLLILWQTVMETSEVNEKFSSESEWVFLSIHLSY